MPYRHKNYYLMYRFCYHLNQLNLIKLNTFVEAENMAWALDNT